MNDDGRWMSHPGIPNAEDIRFNQGMDHAMLINTNLLAAAGRDSFDNRILLNAFPNHWVVLLSEVVADRVNRKVIFSVWTWAQTLLNLSVSYQAFIDNFYGVVSTRLPAPSP